MRMNEEQLEAHSAKLDSILKKHQGWRYGHVHESRRQRIKRLRRWDMMPIHYPDRWAALPHNNYVNLVCHREVGNVELMVTGHERKNPTWNYDKTDLLPFEEWETTQQFNGYCRFKKKPVYECGYNGILSYVQVHGGITFCEHKNGVSTYGFDTSHAGDEDDPLVRNVEWVEYQCLVMARGIQIAAQFEGDYLRFKGNYCRAEILGKYHVKLQRLISTPFVLSNNFGAMINVLFGKL